MTASTPHPDSGAAASRDAARTARRLTAEPRGPRPSARAPERVGETVAASETPTPAAGPSAAPESRPAPDGPTPAAGGPAMQGAAVGGSAMRGAAAGGSATVAVAPLDGSAPGAGGPATTGAVASDRSAPGAAPLGGSMPGAPEGQTEPANGPAGPSSASGAHAARVSEGASMGLATTGGQASAVNGSAPGASPAGAEPLSSASPGTATVVADEVDAAEAAEAADAAATARPGADADGAPTAAAAVDTRSPGGSPAAGSAPTGPDADPRTPVGANGLSAGRPTPDATGVPDASLTGPRGAAAPAARAGADASPAAGPSANDPTRSEVPAGPDTRTAAPGAIGTRAPGTATAAGATAPDAGPRTPAPVGATGLSTGRPTSDAPAPAASAPGSRTPASPGPEASAHAGALGATGSVARPAASGASAPRKPGGSSPVVATDSAALTGADAAGAAGAPATVHRAPGASGPEANRPRTSAAGATASAARPPADTPAAAKGPHTPGAPGPDSSATRPAANGSRTTGTPGPDVSAASPAASRAAANGSPTPVGAARPTATRPAANGTRTTTAPTPAGGDAGVDPRRIVRGDVGVVAVPVVAEPHVPVRPGGRRKNVIGAETTGSIPVHLLFRQEPDADDDGGPATVAMAAPVPAAAPKAVIPAPTRPEPSRPAPTADPKLVERDGAVLPGWIGVVAGALALAGCAAILWWVGAVPDQLTRMLRLPPRPYHGIHLGQWALLALGVLLTLFSLGGLGRGRVGYAWVLTLFGDYRGTVRRTGLVWVSPLLLRRRVDIRLRHWRSEPLSAVDAKGTALRVVVLVVWRIRDTVRAALGVDGHEDYLREQVEAAMARVLSQLPADAFHEDAPTLRDAEAVGEALTRMLSAECAPVGIDVFSAQPTRIEYAPEIAAAMQRRRIAAIDAKHRDSVLTSVVDAVDDVVHRLTTRGLVELDDYERKALVKDLTVAFYTGRTGPVEGA